MKPINFPGANVIFGKDQPNYLPLPAYHEKASFEAYAVSCWKLSFFERIKILFNGKLWLCMATYQKPLTPCILSVHKKSIFDKELPASSPEHLQLIKDLKL